MTVDIATSRNAMDSEAFCLQDESLEEDSGDEFTYEQVLVEGDFISSGDEDLSTALHHASTQQSSSKPLPDQAPDTSPPDHHPEVVEDFVRNYLLSNGLLATAECFQSEWYRLAHCNKLRPHQNSHLPDVYAQNSRLESEVRELERQVTSYREAARLCKEKYVHIQKERDYHRMHHRRMVQEKNKLVNDIKRLKGHYASYEPLLKELKQKYQAITKEKMMASLERDRALSEVGCLQSTLESVQKTVGTSQEPELSMELTAHKHKEYEWPPPPANPALTSGTPLPLCTQFTRTGGLQTSNSLQAHDYAVSSVAVHPSKPLAVTGSDDHSWRMWTIPSGDLVLSGEGHGDWVSSLQFHPSGSQLATTSGDGTVKVWDFERSKCTHTFTEHQQPVWSCSWHWAGGCLASGGMDHTVKLWDTSERGVCIGRLRGHSDSVNGVVFLPYSNTLATCSADKTLSLWDVRSGLCVHTYYGHQHSCNSIIPTRQGWHLYSSDSFGGVLQWDIRTHSNNASWDLGPYAINSLAIDPAGAMVSCASADHTIKLLDTGSDKEWCLEGHKDSVLCVDISPEANTLLSTDNSGTLTIWQ